MTRPAWRQNAGVSAAQRGYGAEWQRIRLVVLGQEPRCQVCGQRATEVDHIVPKAKGGTDARMNLRSLCGPCHRTKTARDSRPASRKRDPERHPGLLP